MSDVDPQPLALRPFQADALERFFASDAPKIQVLSAPTGTGKATTASAIVAEAFRQGATGVAVLATRNVVAQGIAWRAADLDLTPFELHRAVALSTSTGLVPRWPKRVLTFGSIRQAAREPIADALTMRHWDLVVTDLTGGQDDDVDPLRNLLEGTQIDRVLILRDGLSLPNRWSWLNAAPLPYAAPDVPDSGSPPLIFSVVDYERSSAEIDLVGRAQALATDYRNIGVGSRMRLPAAVSSSPLAAQSQAWAAADSLRQLRNRLAHGLPSGPDDKRAPKLGPEALPRLERLRDDLTRFGEDVESLEADSKWDAFLSALRGRETLPTVIFCDFAETAVYVTGRLQAARVEAISLDEPAAVDQFNQRDDIVLVGRDDKLLGLELRHARVSFNYDLPASQRRAFIRWSRLDSSLHDQPAEMVTLIDRRRASPTERMTFTQLRYLVGR